MKIYCFSNTLDGGDGQAYAMAEDGTVLAMHWCSHEGYVSGDLGVTEGSRPDLYDLYAKHYPNGYEMEFIPVKDFESHEGLRKALGLNRLQRLADK